jgi:hypothetical protein
MQCSPTYGRLQLLAVRQVLLQEQVVVVAVMVVDPVPSWAQIQAHRLRHQQQDLRDAREKNWQVVKTVLL